MTEKELMKLQNGSDVRGIALEGVEGEKVNLRPEAANLIAAAFVKFLSKKLGRPAGELKLAIGHDSRLSATSLEKLLCSEVDRFNVVRHCVERASCCPGRCICKILCWG